MSRIILVIDSLGIHTDRLRQTIEDLHCTDIRFTGPEHWRDSVNQSTIGAVLISDAIDPEVRKRLVRDIYDDDPSVPIVYLGEPAD